MKCIHTGEEIQQELPGFILLSHGPLSGGLLGSISLINGDVENIAAFELEEGDKPEEFKQAFVAEYERMPAGSVIFIDVFGGTPFNQAMQYFLESGKPIRAICGMNLGMVMEALAMRSNPEEDFLEKIADAGKKAVMDIGAEWKQRGGQ